MTALLSQKTEVRAIKTLTSSNIDERHRLKLLSKINNVEYFQYPPCKAALERIMIVLQKRQEFMVFSDLIADISLEKDYREVLENSDHVEECANGKEITQMVNTLEKYRKIRAINTMCSNALKTMKEDKFDVDAIIEELTNGITKARQISSETERMLVMGSEDNSRKVVHDVLWSKAPPMLRTGYDYYDNLNGGLPKDGVMVIAATTSGGKSTMLLNLLKNIYKINKVDVCKISLEMTERQEINRLVSNLSGIHYAKFVKGLLSKDEKKKAERFHDEFVKFGEKNDCRFSSLSPERGMSLDDILITVKPYKYDVIGIDYLSLLKGTDVDAQWRVLGNLTAQAKTFSRANKCLVILLAQLDHTSETIRYSKAIQENADVYWYWNYYDKAVRETKTLNVKIGKARDGELDTFDLAEKFEFMRIENPTESDSISHEDEEDDDELENAKAGVS